MRTSSQNTSYIRPQVSSNGPALHSRHHPNGLPLNACLPSCSSAQLLAGPNGLSYQSHAAGMKLSSAKKPLLRLAVGEGAITICAVTIGASNHMFVTGIDREKLCRWVWNKSVCWWMCGLDQGATAHVCAAGAAHGR